MTMTKAADSFALPDLCNGQSILVLVLTAELLVLVQTLTISSADYFRWVHFAKLGFYVLWNVLLCAAVLCALRQRIENLPRNVGATVAYLAIILVSLFVAIAAQIGMFYLKMGVLALQIDSGLLLIQMGIAAIMGGIALRYLYLQQQLQVQQQASLQSRIQALQSRIRPHFLFNSMNIVASLIAIDPDKAEQVVEDISELFRASLRAEDQLVGLDEELALCRQYIGIEQLRLGDRLTVEWDLQTGIEEVPIPSLALQPLIENAVYHGIQPLAAGGTVAIRAWREGRIVHILVSNPRPDETQAEPGSSTQGNQVALANTKARLRAYFDENSTIKTIATKDRFSAEMVYSLN
jgi:two-component system sensor histidine kinase AlgZ